MIDAAAGSEFLSVLFYGSFKMFAIGLAIGVFVSLSKRFY